MTAAPTFSRVRRFLDDGGFRPEPTARGFLSVCPVCRHLDEPSLAVHDVDGAATVACWHNCEEEAIWSALGFQQPVAVDGDVLRRLDVGAMLTAEPPEFDWLVEGLMERGEVVWLAGAGKTGKSMLALLIATVGLSGGGMVGGIAVKPMTRVVYVDAENRPKTVHRRLHLVGLAPRDADGLRYFSARGLDLGKDAHTAVIRREAEGADLVVYDSMIGLHRADEDKSGEVRTLVNRLRVISEETGAAQIGLAHENRGGTLRGSLDWRNAADATLELKRDDDGVRTLQIADRRDGDDDLPPAKFRFRVDSGRLLVEPATVPVRSAVEIACEQIRDVLAEEPDLSQTKVAARVGTTRDNNTFRKGWAMARATASDLPGGGNGPMENGPPLKGGPPWSTPGRLTLVDSPADGPGGGGR